MKPNVFAKWLKVIIVGTTLIGLISCIFVVPEVMNIISFRYPELGYVVMPWEILIYVCSLPCFAAMGISWKIATNIQNDNSFCMENAKLFKWFSYLAIGDSLLFMGGSIIYLFIGLNHIGIMIVEMLIVFAGFAVFVCTAALSYLVREAAELQEDSDLTI